jgi:hypothetical protein
MYVSKYIDPCSGFEDLTCNEGLIYQDLGNIQQATITINSSVFGVDSFLNDNAYPDKARLGINSVDLNLNVDYEISANKVKFLKDITETYSYLEIDYNFDESNFYELSALQNFKTTFNVLFKGVNYAESEAETPFDVELYKVRFNFLSSLDLISDGNFLNLSLQGRVEKDLSRDCKGLDSYFKIKKLIGGCS